MSMEDVFDPRQLYDALRIDAEDQLRTFAARLAALRAGSRSDEDWAELYRAVHTVKGGSALLGLRPIAALAEAMCRAIRRQRVEAGASEQFWLALAEASAALDQLVRAATSGEPTTFEQIHPHLERLTRRD